MDINEIEIEIMKTQIKTTRYSTGEMLDKFKVLGFGAGYVAVVHKETGIKGSLDFGGSPREYFDFQLAD